MQKVYVDGMTKEDKERELTALLQSGVVRDKTQLHDLLVYLGNKAIEAPDVPLKEYTIGVEALSKPRDYDPRLDPSVRVEIGKLRKKIAEHYQQVAAGHPTRMEIPRGAYLPVFCGPTRVSLTSQRWRRWVWPSIAAAVVLSGVAATRLAMRTGSPLAPEVESFWAAHFDRTPTLLVYGAPLFLKIQGTFFRNPDVNRPEEFAANAKAQRVVSALEPREVRPVHTFTGVGEAEAIFHITRVLSSRGVALRLQRSDTVGFEDLKNTHVVFLGGRKYNLQLPELPVTPKFQAVNRRILNVEPKQGEPSEYQTASTTSHGEIVEEYALISVYPGLTPGTRIVALESSSTEGTMAAAEFLSQGRLVGELVSRGVPLKPERGSFRPFQAVIGARFSSGTVVDLSYKTHRVLQ